MKLRLLAVGTKMPAWVTETFKSYNQRLPKIQQLELKEISPVPRNKSTPADKAKTMEGERILAALKPNEMLVLFDEKGYTSAMKEVILLFYSLQFFDEMAINYTICSIVYSFVDEKGVYFYPI